MKTKFSHYIQTNISYFRKLKHTKKKTKKKQLTATAPIYVDISCLEYIYIYYVLHNYIKEEKKTTTNRKNLSEFHIPI